MKFSFYNLIDNAFKFILLFLFNLIWCSYFFNGKNALLISFVTTFILCLILNKINSIKNKKLKIKNSEKSFYENVKTTLLLMNQQELISFFYNLALQKHSAIKHSSFVEVLTNEAPILLFPIFKNGNTTVDDLLEVYKKVKTKKIKRLIFLSNNFDDNVFSWANNFECETVLFNFEQTYINLLENYNYFPKITKVNKPKAKKQFVAIFKIAFNKKKTKGYLLSGMFIFFSSFFVKYKIYYCLFSSLLVMFAIFSYFNIPFNKQTKINVLD